MKIFLITSMIMAAISLFVFQNVSVDKAVAADNDGSPEQNILFVIDRSGSMSSQLPGIKMAVSEIANSLPRNHRAGLIDFSGCNQSDVDSIPLAKRAGRKISAKVNSLRAGGSTALSLALEIVATQMEQMDVCPQVVIFTDEGETCGGSPEKIKEKFKGDRDKFCLQLDIISSSQDKDKLSDLDKLARELGGNLHLAEDIEDILEAYRRIAAKNRAGRGGSYEPGKGNGGGNGGGGNGGGGNGGGGEKEKEKEKAGAGKGKKGKNK